MIATCFATVAAPALAQQSTRDARCILVSGVFAGSATDQKARQLAEMTRSFFLGRLDGRLAPTQLAAAVAAERANVTQATLAPTMNACTQFMNSRAQAVQKALPGTNSKGR
jgi:hypothetical protein